MSRLPLKRLSGGKLTKADEKRDEQAEKTGTLNPHSAALHPLCFDGRVERAPPAD